MLFSYFSRVVVLLNRFYIIQILIKCYRYNVSTNRIQISLTLSRLGGLVGGGGGVERVCVGDYQFIFQLIYLFIIKLRLQSTAAI